MSLHLTQSANAIKGSCLPFRVESRLQPNSLNEAQEAKTARDLAATVNQEIDRVESWVGWIAGFDQSSEDLNPQPGKVAVLGVVDKNGQSIDGFADFQTTVGHELVGKPEVEKAELKIRGQSHLEYSREGDSVEAFVREAGQDTGFFIIGSYAKACTVRRDKR